MKFYFLSGNAEEIFDNYPDDHLQVVTSELLARVVSAQKDLIERARVSHVTEVLRGIPMEDFPKKYAELEEKLASADYLSDEMSEWAASSKKSWEWSVNCLSSLVNRTMHFYKAVHPRVDLVSSICVDHLEPGIIEGGLEPVPRFGCVPALKVAADRHLYFSEYGSKDFKWKGRPVPSWWSILRSRKME